MRDGSGLPALHPLEICPPYPLAQHRGEHRPVSRRESQQGGGELRQRVALVNSGGPFAFALVPGAENVGGLCRRAERSGFEGIGVCVFRFAGANPGAN
jgi:hypothetical protein